jgi:hypothetical protein
MRVRELIELLERTDPEASVSIAPVGGWSEFLDRTVELEADPLAGVRVFWCLEVPPPREPRQRRSEVVFG